MFIKKITRITSYHYELLLSADPSKQIIDAYLSRSFCFECLAKDNCVGILILLPTHPNTLEIINLAVVFDYQEKGIGQQLLQFAIDFAKNNAIKTIEIGTGSTSFKQLYLYQKVGFRIIGIDKDFFLRHYTEPIVENKLILKDKVQLRLFID